MLRFLVVALATVSFASAVTLAGVIFDGFLEENISRSEGNALAAVLSGIHFLISNPWGVLLVWIAALLAIVRAMKDDLDR